MILKYNKENKNDRIFIIIKVFITSFSTIKNTFLTNFNTVSINKCLLNILLIQIDKRIKNLYIK